MAIATQSLGNPNGQGGRKQQKKLQFIQVHCAFRTHGCESQRQAAVSPSLDHKRQMRSSGGVLRSPTRSTEERHSPMIYVFSGSAHRLGGA